MLNKRAISVRIVSSLQPPFIKCGFLVPLWQEGRSLGVATRRRMPAGRGVVKKRNK